MSIYIYYSSPHSDSTVGLVFVDVVVGKGGNTMTLHRALRAYNIVFAIAAATGANSPHPCLNEFRGDGMMPGLGGPVIIGGLGDSGTRGCPRFPSILLPSPSSPPLLRIYARLSCSSHSVFLTYRMCLLAIQSARNVLQFLGVHIAPGLPTQVQSTADFEP